MKRTKEGREKEKRKGSKVECLLEVAVRIETKGMKWP